MHVHARLRVGESPVTASAQLHLVSLEPFLSAYPGSLQDLLDQVYAYIITLVWIGYEQEDTIFKHVGMLLTGIRPFPSQLSQPMGQIMPGDRTELSLQQPSAPLKPVSYVPRGAESDIPRPDERLSSPQGNP